MLFKHIFCKLASLALQIVIPFGGALYCCLINLLLIITFIHHDIMPTHLRINSLFFVSINQYWTGLESDRFIKTHFHGANKIFFQSEDTFKKLTYNLSANRYNKNSHKFLMSQAGYLPKGEVSLYCWPPVWLVWNQLYDNWQFLFLFEKQIIPNQLNRRSMVLWYFPL